jgi:hypothetical protein
MHSMFHTIHGSDTPLRTGFTSLIYGNGLTFAI